MYRVARIAGSIYIRSDDRAPVVISVEDVDASLLREIVNGSSPMNTVIAMARVPVGEFFFTFEEYSGGVYMNISIADGTSLPDEFFAAESWLVEFLNATLGIAQLV